MNELSVDYCVESTIDLLDFLYQRGGCANLPSGKNTSDGRGGHGFERGHRMAKEVVGELVERGFVRPAHSGMYQLTTVGFAYLHAASENRMTPATAEYLTPEDINIVSAEKLTQLGSEIELGFANPKDLWESVILQVYATIGDCTRRVPVAKIKLLCLDAEPAIFDGHLNLADMFEAAPDTLRHHDAICNHDLDGEPAEHCYELADILGLPEAIGRNLIFVEELTVVPGLIGKGVGQRVIKQVLRRYGKGGGLVMIPVEPMRTAGTRLDEKSSFERIAARYLASGFVQHPHVENYLVGDINVCSGLSAPVEND